MSRRPRKQLDGLTYEQFRRQVKERRIDPLYLFTGEELYLQEQALRLLYETVDEGSRVFSIFAFAIGEATASGAKATARDAIDCANELTIMAGRRIVVIRGFDKIKEEELDLVLGYLKRPASTATVVFQASSLDHRRKITSALTKSCTVVGFEPLGDKEAAGWAQNYLKQHGSSIEPAAVNVLIGLTGTSLMRLTNELNKLSACAGGGAVTKTMIEQLVPRAREHSNFELWDAILERNRGRALRLTERLLDDGAEPLMIVGALAGLYRRMLAGKELIARNAPAMDISKSTGQYGYRAREFTDRLRVRAREDIVRGLHRIAEVDYAIKHSLGTPRLQIEYLVAELTFPSARGRV